MKASMVDLRYNMKDILKALECKEDVEITYRGKKRGVIIAKPMVATINPIWLTSSGVSPNQT